MFKKTSVFFLVLLLALSMFAVGCGSDDDDTSLTAIQEKGKLVLGCDDEFPPMGFIDEATGELTGFDIELAEAVCQKLGVELEAKAINWDSKELELESGAIDVIWNGYSIDSDRNEKVEFTKPYLNNEQLVAVRADSDIKDFAGLSGKVLGVQAKSAAETLVTEDKALFESLEKLQTYNTYQNALLDLTGSTRIAGVAGDKILLNYVMQQQPGTYKLLGDTLGKEYFGIGCRQGEVALREAIDKALDDLNSDGTIEAISTKWFGQNIVIRDVPKLTQEELEG